MPLSADDADRVLSRVHLGNVRRPDTHLGVVHYCGRRNVTKGYAESALHNMHNVGTCRSCLDAKEHVTAADTLPYFEVDFGWKILTQQPTVLQEMREIWRVAARGADITLLCWCVPGPCHLRIIKAHLRALATGLPALAGPTSTNASNLR